MLMYETNIMNIYDFCALFYFSHDLKVNIKVESWIKIIRWMTLTTIAFAFAVKLNVACRGVQKELHETRTRLCPKESCCDNYG